MLVVADSSPLIVLNVIGHINILSTLFGGAVIPEQVAQELADAKRPPTVRQWIAQAPSWLTVRTPADSTLLAGLDAGESAAIQLVLELHADLLLIDEIRGRQVAASHHVRLTGTVGRAGNGSECAIA